MNEEILKELMVELSPVIWGYRGGPGGHDF